MSNFSDPGSPTAQARFIAAMSTDANAAGGIASRSERVGGAACIEELPLVGGTVTCPA